MILAHHALDVLAASTSFSIINFICLSVPRSYPTALNRYGIACTQHICIHWLVLICCLFVYSNSSSCGGIRIHFTALSLSPSLFDIMWKLIIKHIFCVVAVHPKSECRMTNEPNSSNAVYCIVRLFFTNQIRRKFMCVFAVCIYFV